MAEEVFTLDFTCPLRDIFVGDHIFIRTKQDRFSDENYPGYVIAEVIGITKPACSVSQCKKVWSYSVSAVTDLPAGIPTLQNCDIEGVRLSRDCCIVSGEWEGEEIHLTKEDGSIIVIAAPTVECSAPE